MCAVLKVHDQMAQWLSWLERRPVTAEVTGSSPVWVVLYGILAQLGEHLPYKQRVTGSSPVGPIRLYQAQSFILIWRNSSVGESTWFIPMVSGVQIPFPLLNEEQV